jgi:putative transposase
MLTEFVLVALEQAQYDRQPTQGEGLMHYRDRSSQHVCFGTASD